MLFSRNSRGYNLASAVEMFKKEGELVAAQDESGSLFVDSKEMKQTQQSQTDKPQIAQMVPVPPKQPSIFEDFTQAFDILRELLLGAKPTEQEALGNSIVNTAKLRTSENFWFFINCVYFSPIAAASIPKLDEYWRTSQQKPLLRFRVPHCQSANIKQNYDMDDDLFILQNRNLVLKNTRNDDLAHIQQAPLQRLISYWDQELDYQQQQTHTLLSIVQDRIQKEGQTNKRLAELMDPVKYHQEYSEFEYVQLEDRQILRSRKHHQKLASIKTICEMCLSSSQLPTNPFVQCSGCDVIVHRKCYPGLSPDMVFQCYTCSKKTPEQQTVCAICVCKGGLMLPTQLMSNDYILGGRFLPTPLLHIEDCGSDTKIRIVATHRPQDLKQFPVLVHATCFRWVPQLYFDEEAEVVRGFRNIRQKKLKYICSVCQIPEGHCVQCQQHGCQKSFHPQCARRFGVSMATVKFAQRIIRQISCQKHRIPHQYQVMQEVRNKKINELKKLFEGVEKITQNLSSWPTGWRPKKPHAEKPKFCICRSEHKGEEGLQCQNCKEWFHQQCVNITNGQQFLCPNCA